MEMWLKTKPRIFDSWLMCPRRKFQTRLIILFFYYTQAVFILRPASIAEYTL